jgi:predicted solute-binding protein
MIQLDVPNEIAEIFEEKMIRRKIDFYINTNSIRIGYTQYVVHKDQYKKATEALKKILKGNIHA